MKSPTKHHLLLHAPFETGWMSFSLFWTIDRGMQRAEISELRSSESLPCQRSFVSTLELLSSIALSSARTFGFYHVLWAQFRRAKSFFSIPGGRDSHAQMGAVSFDKNKYIPRRLSINSCFIFTLRIDATIDTISICRETALIIEYQVIYSLG